jgi:hypothetical protein
MLQALLPLQERCSSPEPLSRKLSEFTGMLACTESMAESIWPGAQALRELMLREPAMRKSGPVERSMPSTMLLTPAEVKAMERL